jgi:hypothetical protein
MNETLVICNNFQYNIDLAFYEKNKINHLEFNLNKYDDIIKNFNFENFKNIIVILDDVMFDNICKTSNPFNSELHHSYISTENDKDIFFKNFNIFLKNFPNNIKVILYDNNIEIPQKSIVKFILEWMGMRNENYFISSRFNSIMDKQSMTGLVYLPLIYSFHSLNFNKYDKLDYSTPTKPKYNFITYLGNFENIDKIEYRFNFLKEMLKDKINELKHEKYSNSKLGLKYLLPHRGEGHYWNLLDILSAKIQLIFETIPLTMEYHDEYYFSEKTMKLFLLPHPYFLLVNGTALNKLEEFGFKFPEKCFSYDEFITAFTSMLLSVDVWIEKNNKIFEDNQENFYKIINSTDLNHHLFLEEIFKNTNI